MTDLATRIEAAYMRRTGRTTPRGARTWFARQARCHKQSVSRWIAGTVPFEGPPLAVLELLEVDPSPSDVENVK
jgi:hypothetical protein